MDINEEKKKHRKEYLRNYNRKLSDLKQRQKPEYQQRELLRLKRRYEKIKEYQIFKRAIPYFLTI